MEKLKNTYWIIDSRALLSYFQIISNMAAAKQRKFIEAIATNNLAKASELLHDPEVNPTMDDEARETNAPLVMATLCRRYDIVHLLLSDPRVDPRAMDSLVMSCAASDGDIETVEMLLKDERIDPTDNRFINFAGVQKHDTILRTLLKQQRISGTYARIYKCVRTYIPESLAEAAWARRKHVVMARARMIAGYDD